MKPNNTETISYAAIAVIVVSLFFIGMEITGYAVTDNETGRVNVTINTAAALNFTTSLLDFGNGAVTGGNAGATINSEGSQGVGTWAATTGELILENIGNVNVSLNISANKSVADFIGGNSPTFKAKVSNDEANSCSGTQTFSGYASLTTTPQIACSVFEFNDTKDSVNIDFELYIPNNAAGAKTVGVVAIGTYT